MNLMKNKMTPKQLLDRLVYAIKHEVNYYSQFNQSEPIINQDYKIVEQTLTEYEKQKQILEVLKNKGVDIDYLNYCIQFCKKHKEKIIRAFVYYNQTSPNRLKLTKEEFNLIKEWLK